MILDEVLHICSRRDDVPFDGLGQIPPKTIQQRLVWSSLTHRWECLVKVIRRSINSELPRPEQTRHSEFWGRMNKTRLRSTFPFDPFGFLTYSEGRSTSNCPSHHDKPLTRVLWMFNCQHRRHRPTRPGVASSFRCVSYNHCDQVGF